MGTSRGIFTSWPFSQLSQMREQTKDNIQGNMGEMYALFPLCFAKTAAARIKDTAHLKGSFLNMCIQTEDCAFTHTELQTAELPPLS